MKSISKQIRDKDYVRLFRFWQYPGKGKNNLNRNQFQPIRISFLNFYNLYPPQYEELNDAKYQRVNSEI